MLVEQALALARDLKQTCRQAPHGQALAQAGQLALPRDRAPARAALKATPDH